MIIAIDFDGTCVTHEYPNIGKQIGASRVIQQLVDAGHDIILYTMRSGKELADAEEWFYNNIFKEGWELYGVNNNPKQITWTTSPKVYAQLYIDDAALGCPLTKKSLKVNEKNFLKFTIMTISLFDKCQVMQDGILCDAVVIGYHYGKQEFDVDYISPDTGKVAQMRNISFANFRPVPKLELCEILTHIYGHNKWYNPYRNAGFSIGGSKQTPFDAYQELDDPFQRIVISLFGRRPEKNDGLHDASAPIGY